jgi:hypothetical protein
VLRDVDGKCRFNSKFTNRTDVEGALAALAATEPWRDLVQSDGEDVVRIYENVFRHHQFTGRSGAMYAYEGIGSIYWHMVAKLLVAIQEAVLEAHRSVVPSEDLHRLVACYRRVRSGLGFNKTAAEYGAFPTDPYSHTPAHAGAQQPGMTGQVKEEVITRAGELGVRVVDGTLGFEPLLLRPSEFFPVTATWRVHHVAGDEEELTLPPGSLGFTVCGVPVVYRLTRAEPTVSWIPAGGQSSTLSGSRLDPEVSRQVLGRTGDVRRIEVAIPESMLNREGS